MERGQARAASARLGGAGLARRPHPVPNHPRYRRAGDRHLRHARLGDAAAAAPRLRQGAREVAAVRGLALRPQRPADRQLAARLSGAPPRLDPAQPDRASSARRDRRRGGPALPRAWRGRLLGARRRAARLVGGQAHPRRQHALDAGRGLPRARARHAGIARAVGQAPPDARRRCAGAGLDQGPGARGLSQPRRLPRRGAGNCRRRARPVRQDPRDA